MTDKDALDTYIAAASTQLGLDIDPAYQDGVRQFYILAMEMADVLDAAPLEPHDAALAPTLRLPGLHD